LIEAAHHEGERLGLAVWNEDEAGPYQAIPQAGHSWQLMGQPARQPHEYVRGGTAKLLTLLHPATGTVWVKGTINSANAVLHPWLQEQHPWLQEQHPWLQEQHPWLQEQHPWLQEQLSAIVEKLPAAAPVRDQVANRAQWERWQEGLSEKFTLLAELPPLRLLLIWDNLAGHKTPEMVCWLMHHGIMPLYMPLGGSWLNMAESVQRILTRRALDAQHPRSSGEIIGWLEATARAWNRQPTAFVWGGARHARRERARRRRGRPLTLHAIGGSGACFAESVVYAKAA
jgi:DDE superfamily endonuclease